MKYIPIKSFPQYIENPFLDEKETGNFNKFVVLKGNNIIINQVIFNNGTRFDLSENTRRVFTYIFTHCLIPNRFIFWFDYDEAKQTTGYKANNIVRSGLSSLIEMNMIARSTNPFKFFLNPSCIK